VGPMQAILSGVITIFFYAMIIAAVWKLFQMATDLGEIKTLLADISRNKPIGAAIPQALDGPISLESAEALLREVAAESHVLSATEPPKTTA
jgi:hypothetical protein